jgi:hypothetical protein
MPLFSIRSPDGLDCVIVAPDALQVLRMHHTEASAVGRRTAMAPD